MAIIILIELNVQNQLVDIKKTKIWTNFDRKIEIFKSKNQILTLENQIWQILITILTKNWLFWIFNQKLKNNDLKIKMLTVFYLKYWQKWTIFKILNY